MAATALSLLDRPAVSAKTVARFAWAVVAYNVLVILWGALVRATGSGAGCGNHWPLCNGQVIPLAPRVDTMIEFTHRLMVGGATFAVLALLIATFMAAPRGAAARLAVVLSTVLLVNEALLGAILVKLGYVTENRSVGRVVVLSVHLSNTLLLLAALTLTAIFLSTGVSRRALAERRDLPVVLIGLISTIVVGVSGSLAALGDTLFPSISLGAALARDFALNSPWILRVRWVHPASVLFASLFVYWILRRSWPADRALGRVIIALVTFQFAAGILDIILLAPVWMQVVHLLGADLYWVAILRLSARWTWPNLRDPLSVVTAAA